MTDPAAVSAGEIQLVDCADPQQRAAVEAQQGFGRRAPITPGREFAEEALWNVWVDTRYTDRTDHRHDLDSRGRGGYLTLGADRRVSESLVAGVSLSIENNRSDGFGGALRTESNGFTISPYLGIQLSPRWSLDASLGFGQVKNDTQIDVLSGGHSTYRYSASLNATGQYALGENQLRPKFSVSYTHSRNDAHDFSGSIFGIPVSLPVAKSLSNTGVTGVAVEINRIVRMSGGTTVVPYAELGANYEFERPNDGQILTGNLTSATTSPWTGSLRMGARALVSRSTFIEASAGYLSLGQNGLKLWEGRLFLSRAF